MPRTEENPIVMELVTDPVELAEARIQDERFEKNWAWWEAHAPEAYASHRGKVVCISGEELFVADTTADVLAQAKAAHPDDNGRFTRYIPRERAYRIYSPRLKASVEV